MSLRRSPGVRGLLPTTLALGAGALLAAAALAAPGASGVRELEAEIAALDTEAATAAAAREDAAQAAERIREAIARNVRDLRDIRVIRAESQERLATRLVELYTREPATLTEVLLSAGSLSEAIEGYRIRQELARHDSAIVDGLVETTADLQALRGELAREREARSAALAESEARLDDVQRLVRQRRGVLARARAALIAAEAADQARRLAADQKRREKAAAAGRVSAPAAQPAPAAEPVPAPPGSGAADSVRAHLARIAQCESGGNPKALSSSGLYRGKYQFDLATWQAVGGSGDPIDASEAEQDLRAEILYERSGPAPWPICGA